MRNRILTILGISVVVGIVLYILGVKMTKADLAISAAAEPIFCAGGTIVGEHCESGFPITNSLIMTVLVDILLALTIFFGVRNMNLIPTGFQNVVEAMVEGFYNFAQGVDRKNVAKFFPLCASIFFFVLYANFFALIPGVGSIGSCVVEHGEAVAEEHAVAPSPGFSGLYGYCEGGKVVPFLRSPSADLNVTLAWALVAVIMVEFFGFQALGIGYLWKFINFQGFRTSFLQGLLDLFIGLLELISEFVRIVAFAFRLFGNIFAGEVVLIVMSFLFPYILPLPFYGLELFVAFIQAVIFAVLTLVFMSLAVISHSGHEEHGHAEAAEAEH